MAFHILVFLDTWDQSHLLNLHNKLLNLNLTVRGLSSLFSLLKDKCYLKLYLQHSFSHKDRGTELAGERIGL